MIPQPYTPSALRTLTLERRKLMYGLGLVSPQGNLGMCYGPTESLHRCLEQPAVDGAVLVRFNCDGTDEITWRYHNNAWHAQPDVNHYDYTPSGPPPLTLEDLRSLAYFAIEKNDPTRWTGWAQKAPLVAQHLPEFYQAYHAREDAQAAFIKAAQALTQVEEALDADSES